MSDVLQGVDNQNRGNTQEVKVYVHHQDAEPMLDHIALLARRMSRAGLLLPKVLQILRFNLLMRADADGGLQVVVEVPQHLSLHEALSQRDLLLDPKLILVTDDDAHLNHNLDVHKRRCKVGVLLKPPRQVQWRRLQSCQLPRNLSHQ